MCSNKNLGDPRLAEARERHFS